MDACARRLDSGGAGIWMLGNAKAAPAPAIMHGLGRVRGILSVEMLLRGIGEVLALRLK